MAETINPTTNAPGVPATPNPVPAAPITPTKPKSDSGWLKSLIQLMSSTTCLILGIGFVVLSIIIKLHPNLIPPFLKSTIDQLIPHLPYFIIGIGFFFLGLSRSMAVREYTEAKKKNKKNPHSWKIPLISAQVFFFQLGCFLYALPVALGWVQPITNQMGLVFLMLLFCVYVLWYLVAHSMNRFPAIAGLRMAVVALVLAGLSCSLWVLAQMVFVSLLVGLLAIVAILISALIKVKGVEEYFTWPKITCLVISVILLAHVGWHALPFDNPQVELVGLVPTTKGLKGTITALNYFQNEHKPDDIKIAISQKDSDGWTLQVQDLNQNPEIPTLPSFKVSAGDENFRSIFVQNGNFLLIDKVSNGQRGIWKVDATNGTTVQLKITGVQAFEDGVPWSNKNGQLLYVTEKSGKYVLNVWTLATGKSKTLFSSENPIHSPSWVNVDDPKKTPSWSKYDEKIAYADGMHGLFYVFNLKTNQKELLKSDLENIQGEKFTPEGTVVEVIPSPDSFRYLYVTRNNAKSIISVVRSDGTKRDKLYETNSSISELSWNSDSQKIVFEEKHEGMWQSMELGFLGSFTNIKLLDANTGTVENIIPAQISNHSPTLSPDGAKLAFVASEGLWYPSMNQSIWVALLR